jgi:transcriptional regulator with XRE-family HTH domain
MNISKTIREQRNRLKLSQEDLGERIYVTRQTISSWENDKSYPDINSLILLSQVFDMTIDNLIKGDLEMMKQKIETNDITSMKQYRNLAYIGAIICAFLLPPSMFLGFIPGLIIATVIGIAACYFAKKMEKIKKQYDVQTYREIVAFLKGETLDEIGKIRESGKIKYQRLIYYVVLFGFSLIISGTFFWFLFVR